MRTDSVVGYAFCRGCQGVPERSSVDDGGSDAPGRRASDHDERVYPHWDKKGDQTRPEGRRRPFVEHNVTRTLFREHYT
ncbi:MAG: hypothetical protein JWM49_2098 [Microbacteriaceae bacterium]|nr:hypothetical protein [Microbacteriaceae bacterium]